MQGLWSAHRRAKVNVNLNSVPETSAGVASLATSPREPAVVDASSSDVAGADGQQVQDPEVEEAMVSAVVAVSSTSGKRKSRTLRSTEDSSKRAKLTNQSRDYEPPAIRPSDVGGADDCIEMMRELVIMPLKHPEVYLHIGVQPTRGILLHGPPGCGKTLLANAIAGVCAGSSPACSRLIVMRRKLGYLS